MESERLNERFKPLAFSKHFNRERMNLGAPHLARAIGARAHHCDVKISKVQINLEAFTKLAL